MFRNDSSNTRLDYNSLFKEVNPYDPVEKLSSLVVLRHLQKQAKIRSGNAANKQRKNLRVAWQWRGEVSQLTGK